MFQLKGSSKRQQTTKNTIGMLIINFTAVRHLNPKALELKLRRCSAPAAAAGW